jgi:hypothetical protein
MVGTRGAGDGTGVDSGVEKGVRVKLIPTVVVVVVVAAAAAVLERLLLGGKRNLCLVTKVAAAAAVDGTGELVRLVGRGSDRGGRDGRCMLLLLLLPGG